MTVVANSLAAYDGIDLTKRQADVLEAISAIGSGCDLDIAAHLGWTINRLPGRRGELVELGLVEKCGEKKNEFGNTVSIWRVKPRQQELFAA